MSELYLSDSMKLLLSFFALLATTLGASSATVYPASTNANQTFTGTNTFTKPIQAAGGVTATGGTFAGNGAGLTNLNLASVQPASVNLTNWSQLSTSAPVAITAGSANSVAASNVTSGGVLPLGALASTNGAAPGWPLVFTGNGRAYSNILALASYTPYVLTGTNVVISPTNGNLQSWTLTNASWAALDTATTNWVETIRLNIWNSNTVTWAIGNLSNMVANATAPSNNVSVILFDHNDNTNLWWASRLR